MVRVDEENTEIKNGKILILVAGALFVYSKLDLIKSKKLDNTKVGKNEVSEETQKTFEGYTTIACFGLDNREQGVYESGNSDVIMLMNINNDTHEVNLMSVYRDTYLNVAGEGQEEKFQKANAAYAYGGPIDILGGVDIDVESEEERKYLNDYVSYTSEYVGGSDEEVEHTGLQTLNGVQAVSYARIRYTAGDDYKRAERQRRVLTEMIKKAKSASLPELNSLINTVFPQISTDLDKKDIISMATVMIKYDMANSGGFPYSKDTFTPSKSIGSVVAPCDLESNVIELHKRLYGTDNYTPSETVKKYSEHIVDVSGYTAEWKADNRFSGQDEFFGNGTQTTDDGSGSTEDTTE